MTASADHIAIDASTLDVAGAYRLLVGSIVPRPIAWITTRSDTGVVNAAPFSSFNYVCHDPPMVAVNIGKRDGALKDTARNIVATGELVVNIVNEPLLDLMHASSAEHPPETSEVELLGIATLPGRFGSVPRIAASPIHLECRLEQVVPLGSGFNTLYIAAVRGFHLSPEVYDGRRVDSQKLRPVCRLGGPWYAGLGEIFHRPVAVGNPGNVV